MNKKITLLDISKTIYPEDSKKNIIHGFKVDKKLKSLFIDFNYQPKEFDNLEKAKKYISDGFDIYAPGEFIKGYGKWEDYLPLLNLVTVSLDGCGEYRGCAHRHSNNQHHEIGTDIASPGFLKGLIQPGLWSLVVNVHAVVTEKCQYFIKVEGEYAE